MAQKRFTGYKISPIDSFDTTNMFSGILLPGVYSGFRIVVEGGELKLKNTDPNTNSQRVDKLKNITRDSVLITQMGKIIAEDEDIILNYTPNTTINWRIDAVYCEHIYSQNQGGIQAVYGIQLNAATNNAPPGILGNYVLDNFLSPETRIPIGLIFTPPQSDFNDSNFRILQYSANQKSELILDFNINNHLFVDGKINVVGSIANVDLRIELNSQLNQGTNYDSDRLFGYTFSANNHNKPSFPLFSFEEFDVGSYGNYTLLSNFDIRIDQESTSLFRFRFIAKENLDAGHYYAKGTFNLDI